MEQHHLSWPSTAELNVFLVLRPAAFAGALAGECNSEEADVFRGHVTEMARMSLDDSLVLQIHRDQFVTIHHRL